MATSASNSAPPRHVAGLSGTILTITVTRHDDDPYAAMQTSGSAGILVAVFSYLNETVDGELQDRWFLEAGFGRCQEVKPPVFDSREEAEQWVFDRMNGR